jgi:hypothetical protein
LKRFAHSSGRFVVNTKTNGQWSSNLLLGIVPSANKSGSTETRLTSIHVKENKMQAELRVGGTAHRVLSVLAAKGNMSAPMIKKTGIIAGKTLVDIENAIVYELLPKGFVMLVNEMFYGLTQKGLDMKIELGGLDKLFKAPRKTVLAQQNDLFARGTYEGTELRSTCMRRGAYDAYNLPSLTFSGLTYRKVPL